MRTGHLVDWSTHGLVSSRARQLADPPAVAVLVVITLIYGHKTLQRSQKPFWSNKHVRLVICYVILCPHYHTIKTKTTSTTSGGIRKLPSPRLVQSASWHICELTSYLGDKWYRFLRTQMSF